MTQSSLNRDSLLIVQRGARARAGLLHTEQHMISLTPTWLVWHVTHVATPLS
jgi:hypothetical protein